MGATPLLIPSLSHILDIDEIASRLDGLLLTGSASNIDPKAYGDGAEDAPGPFDPDRDKAAMALADAFLQQSKPVFGICRGFQELNVHFGGTLSRNLSDGKRQLNHHAPDGVSYEEMFEYGHEVILENSGCLSRLYETSRINVNSVHYQGVDKLGSGLDVLARAPDGVIEAFSSLEYGAPILAVQWHPEWDTPNNLQYQKLFAYMGKVLKTGSLEV
jgi:putative glutamine amidotransferase